MPRVPWWSQGGGAVSYERGIPIVFPTGEGAGFRDSTYTPKVQSLDGVNRNLTRHSLWPLHSPHTLFLFITPKPRVERYHRL